MSRVVKQQPVLYQDEKRAHRDSEPVTTAPPHSRHPKIIFCVIACVAFMSFSLLSTSMPTSIYGSSLFRAFKGAGCAGMRQRLMSSSASVPKPVQNAKYALPSGDSLPAIALGTWQAKPGEVGTAVAAALKEGYRHIDGAWIYRNEKEVGEAWKSSGIARKDLWLTSKLWNSFHNPEDVEAALDETLTHLQTDYLDLYLMHWPVAFEKEQKDGKPVVNHTLTENPYPTWKKLEELVKKGKIRNIGVSNFNVRRLTALLSNQLEIKPAVNQVELNWFNPQPQLLEWSKENGILLEAYSPFGSNNQVKESLNVPEVKEVAATLGITAAQVLISWQYQRGVVVLPKSVTPTRIRENLQVFELPKDAFHKIEKSAVGHKQQRIVDPSRGWGVDIFEDGKQ